MNKKIAQLSTVAVGLSLLVVPLIPGIAAASTPTWDVTGTYVTNFVLGGTYAHDMVLTQDASGGVTGSGGYPAGGPHTYTWHITSGTVSGNQVNLTAVYDTGAPGTIMHMTGTVASDGTLSGNWDDNFGGTRTGTWSTATGTAMALGSIAAEDFGVVNYDTGLGMLKGYTAGFGLTNATFAGAQSVVVKLYSGATLLQTNTATAKVGTDITGNQISSPFDVSGNFNYVTDGYWTNVREAQYGQSMPATKVVATVTLANGKVVTAENTILTGDPTTIYPVVTPTGADLAVTKTVNDATAEVHQNLTYVVTVTNHGPVSATTVAVTDVLPAGLAFVSATASQGSYVSGTGLWTVGTLADEASATLTIVASVKEGTKGQTIVNTASAHATETDLVSTNNQASQSIVVSGGTVPPTKDKDECKEGGWKKMTNPSYKNQGQCVSAHNHKNHEEKGDKHEDKGKDKNDD